MNDPFPEFAFMDSRRVRLGKWYRRHEALLMYCLILLGTLAFISFAVVWDSR